MHVNTGSKRLQISAPPATFASETLYLRAVSQLRLKFRLSSFKAIRRGAGCPRSAATAGLLKATHPAGTESSACSPLPGFEPQSGSESRAHTQLRRLHPRGRLKAHRSQPRGKASVRAPPRSPTASPGRTARDGAEALERPPRAQGGCGHGGAAITCCHREDPAALGTAAFLSPRPGCAATERSGGRSRRPSSAKGRYADTR